MLSRVIIRVQLVVRLVGVTAIQTASRAIGSKLAEDVGLFLATSCVSDGRISEVPCGRGDQSNLQKNRYRSIQIAADKTAND